MTLPWERRKRKCGNCRWWIKAEDPRYMGECDLTMYRKNSVRGSLAYSPAEGFRMQTSDAFYCCQYWKKDDVES